MCEITLKILLALFFIIHPLHSHVRNHTNSPHLTVDPPGTLILPLKLKAIAMQFNSGPQPPAGPQLFSNNLKVIFLQYSSMQSPNFVNSYHLYTERVAISAHSSGKTELQGEKLYYSSETHMTKSWSII